MMKSFKEFFMHLTLLATQLTFFAKNRFLELEEVLSDEEEKSLLLEISSLMKSKEEKLSCEIPFFKQGRDLWRKSPLLFQWASKKRILFLLSSLMRSSSIRLGFDQLFEIPLSGSFSLNLHNLSSIQGTQCALLMRLTSPDEEKGFFCQKRKSLLFFRENLPLSLDNPGLYWMVVYMKNGSRYVQREEDPFTNLFKNDGYAFGDELNRQPLFFV
jgi:hypothetical protein